MKKILITGAKGMLGQDLCPILEKVGYNIVKTDIDTLDITSLNEIDRVFSIEKPDYVIHCAAYTNVDKAEEDKTMAEKINTKGSENIALGCKKIDATMVYISTDYVFDGNKNTPYKPTDTPNPINVYGKTKYDGEEAIRKILKNHIICRTSWLYGIYGKNFVETMISLAQKPELKVVDDQIGCPTWTVELANAIVELIKNNSFGTFHTCGSGQTSWHGFAKKIFELENLNVNLKPCTTDEFPRAAKRPKYSVMDNNGICRNWEIALNDYVKLRKA